MRATGAGWAGRSRPLNCRAPDAGTDASGGRSRRAPQSTPMFSRHHLLQRAREKMRAVKALDDAIARIAREGREPDSWERLFLLQGIQMLSCGNYAFASIDAELAATPASERTPGFAA